MSGTSGEPGLAAGPATTSTEEVFRRLVIADPDVVMAISRRPTWLPRLDARSEALVRIASLVAVGAPESVYVREVAVAGLAGVELEDLLRVLMAIADTVGSSRVFAAAPRLAQAAGYDVETALEAYDPSDHAGSDWRR